MEAVMKNILLKNEVVDQLEELKNQLNLESVDEALRFLYSYYLKEEQQKFNQHIKELFGV